MVNVVANVKSTESTVVEALAKLLLDDHSSFVRERCAREFWEMGQNHNPIPIYANDALVLALKADSDEGVREQAAKALASNSRLANRNRDVLKKCADTASGVLREVCQQAAGRRLR